MATITLIRHGASSCDANCPIKISQFEKWIDSYDKAGILPSESITEYTYSLVQKATYIVSSDLNRARETVEILTEKQADEVNPLFREAGMPIFPRMLHMFKAKPKSMNVIIRICWLSGYTNNSESNRSAKKEYIKRHAI